MLEELLAALEEAALLAAEVDPIEPCIAE